MPAEDRPKGQSTTAFPERRRQPRSEVDPMDWESKVLSRIQRRVTSLVTAEGAGPESTPELGWEEASLIVLQRRVGTLKSD